MGDDLPTRDGQRVGPRQRKIIPRVFLHRRGVSSLSPSAPPSPISPLAVSAVSRAPRSHQMSVVRDHATTPFPKNGPPLSATAFSRSGNSLFPSPSARLSLSPPLVPSPFFLPWPTFVFRSQSARASPAIVRAHHRIFHEFQMRQCTNVGQRTRSDGVWVVADYSKNPLASERARGFSTFLGRPPGSRQRALPRDFGCWARFVASCFFGFAGICDRSFLLQ